MKLGILIISFFLLPFFATQAQDADDILSRYFKGSGGLDNWNSLKTMKMTGKLSQGGMSFDIVVFRKRPDLQRSEIRLQGQNIIQAYDGEKGWMINPFTGNSDAQYLPEEMNEEFRNDPFESDFLNYRSKGHQAELLGKDSVDGSLAYKIKLTRNNGEVEYHFFNAENYLPLMEEKTIRMGPAKGQQAETHISDYRNVDGLMMPFSVVVKAGGQTVQELILSEYALNQDMADSLFTFPGVWKPEEK